MATSKQAKRDRQRVAAEERAAARRKQQQRRTLGYVLGGIALIGVVVLGVVALMGDGDGGVGPSAAGEVSVSGPPRAEPLAAGDPVPDFSAPGIGGGTVSWGDFLGKPVVLPVWAPWCPHCQAELPVLDRVMEDFPDVGYVTIVTSIGESPGPDPASFLEENGITVPTATDDSAGTLAAAFGIQRFPSLFFVDSAGRVVVMAEGEVEEDTLRQVIGSLT